MAKEEPQKEETQPTKQIVQEAPLKLDSPGSEPRITLRQKFPPGKYEVVQTKTNKQTLTTEGRAVTKISSLSKWFEMDVSEPDASGHTTCVVMMTRIRDSEESGLSYDTDDPDSLRANATASIISKIFLNRKFVSKFGQDGELVTISGWDQMWDGIIDEMSNDKPIAVQMIQQFKQMDKEAFANQNLGLVFYIIPDEPIGVGAIWHKATSENIPYFGAAKISAKYELRKIEQTTQGKIAHITCVSNVKLDQSKRTQFGTMSMTLEETDLRQKGEIQLNVDTGLMISSRMERDGEMEMSIIARGKNIAGNLQISHMTETTTRLGIGERQSKKIAPSEPLARKEE